MKSDRGRDSLGHSSIGSITVSTVRKPNDDYMPHLSNSKTTTITPITSGQYKHYPSSISEIIDLDSDNDNSRRSPRIRSYATGTVPNMKKRKLDILRQGGLEVTAISNKTGPMNHNIRSARASPLIIPPVNVSKLNGTRTNTSLMGAHANAPKPQFQSVSMYTRTMDIFGDPKDLIQPAQSTEYNCIDLTVEKCDPTIRIRLPESTTIQKAHTFSPFAQQNLPDPNLQITLVPPIQSTHNSLNFVGKRKVMDNGKLATATISIGGSARTALSMSGDNASISLPPALISSPAALLPTTTGGNSARDANNLILPPPTILNVPNMNDLKINQLFLQNMLDPTYLTNFYNNPSLLFQQSLPPEILQGLGIIPISKS